MWGPGPTGSQLSQNLIALYVYFDVPNPLHWPLRIHLRAPELLVTDELGPESCTLLSRRQRVPIYTSMTFDMHSYYL